MTNCDGALNLMNDLTTLLQDRGSAPAQSRSMTSAVALQQQRIKRICHRTRTYVMVSLSPRLGITLWTEKIRTTDGNIFDKNSWTADRRWCTTRHHEDSTCKFHLKCDGTRWRTGGEVKGKMANGMGSQYSSHYLGIWCIQHYYCWCPHLGCQ